MAAPSGSARLLRRLRQQASRRSLAQDLSDIDFNQFKPAQFEFAKKEAQLNMRLPQPLLDAVKERARTQGMPYTRYIRLLLERDVTAK